MPCSSHKTILPFNWLILTLSKFQYGKNEGDAPEGWWEKGERDDDAGLKVSQTQGEDPGSSPLRGSGTPSTSAPPSPAPDTPPRLEEIMKRIAEANQLEQEGRSPQSLLTWQLAQMAAEARPSTLGGEDLAQKKLHPTMGGKAPKKEFLKTRVVKKTWNYWPGHLPFMRSASFKRSQSSSFGNSLSHG